MKKSSAPASRECWPIIDTRRNSLPQDAGERRFASFESLEQTCLSFDAVAGYEAVARHEITISIGRSTVAVRFSRASAAAAFAQRFVGLLGHRAADAVVFAVDLPGEALFWRSPDRARRWPHNASDELLVFFADNVALHEYLTTSADIGIHAAVIASPSRVVAIVGVSTAGKTTTAIAAARNGFALYSDERCILQGGHVVPFLRAITVREGSRAALLADAVPPCSVQAQLREMPARGETAIPPSVLLGERAGGPPRKLGGMLIISGRDATPAVEACSLYSALPALLRSMLSRDTGIERAARLITELRDVPIYRLRLGTPDATARSIQRTLDEVVAEA